MSWYKIRNMCVKHKICTSTISQLLHAYIPKEKNMQSDLS